MLGTPAPAHRIAGGGFLYTNVGLDTDVLAHELPDSSARWFVMVRGEQAATTFPMRVDLADDERLVQAGDDTVAVLAGDRVGMVMSAAPGADAAGQPVPSRLFVDDEQVVLGLDHHGDRTTYPVMVESFGYPGGGACGEEVRWCAAPSRYRLCNRARRHANAASAEAARQFPPEALHNGRGDAFRHCYWNGRMAINFGEGTAKEFADRHESCRDDNNEKTMDLRITRPAAR